MTLIFMGAQRLIKIFFWTVKEWLNEVNGVTNKWGEKDSLAGFFRPVQTVKWMFTHQSTSAESMLLSNYSTPTSHTHAN